MPAAGTLRPAMGQARESGSRKRQAPQELSFEKALERLEEIAERLEASGFVQKGEPTSRLLTKINDALRQSRN